MGFKEDVENKMRELVKIKYMTQDKDAGDFIDKPENVLFETNGHFPIPRDKEQIQHKEEFYVVHTVIYKPEKNSIIVCIRSRKEIQEEARRNQMLMKSMVQPSNGKW